MKSKDKVILFNLRKEKIATSAIEYLKEDEGSQISALTGQNRTGEMTQ